MQSGGQLHLSKNVKFTIAYEGSRYLGWQRLGGDQNKKTIQGVVEETISEVVGRKVTLSGSGRTDAGVHAYGQVANGRIPVEVKSSSLISLVNKRLPADIQIVAAEVVSDDFHSRYDATYKVYQYRMDLREVPSVFTRTRTLSIQEPLQVEKMREAAALLIGTHDFKGYASAMPDGRGTIKTIDQIEIGYEGQELLVELRGDGFLYNMVRIIVGTLLEVGMGKREVRSVILPLKTKQRKDAGPTVSSIGLYLKEVGYQS